MYSGARFVTATVTVTDFDYASVMVPVMVTNNGYADVSINFPEAFQEKGAESSC